MIAEIGLTSFLVLAFLSKPRPRAVKSANRDAARNIGRRTLFTIVELAGVDRPGFQDLPQPIVTRHDSVDWAAKHLHVSGYTASSFSRASWAKEEKSCVHVAKLRAEESRVDDDSALINARLAWFERRTEACESLHHLLAADSIDIKVAHNLAGSAEAWATLVHLFQHSGDAVVRDQLGAAVLATATAFAHRAGDQSFEPFGPM